MEKIKKILAGVGGVGVLLLALYLAVFLFVILLVVGGLAAIYVYFKGGKIRAEFGKQHAEFNRQHAEAQSGTIDGDYVVVEEHSLDRNPSERP